MIESKLIEVPRESPNRCQGSTNTGIQCYYAKEPGSDYCAKHAANKQAQSQAIKAAKMYQLGQYQARMEEFAGHSAVKTLRGEIAILRMTLERVIDTCSNPALFAINAGRISDLVLKVEKLVMSCNRLEISTGDMLDKTKAMQLAQAIVESISRHISDPELLDKISIDIQQQIGDITII